MQEFVGYTDIHSHILPGVDDGASDLNESRQMLKIAYEQGIRTIIATPHYNMGSSRSVSLLQERLALVQKEAYDIDHNFRIFLGNEIYYEDGCLEAVQQKKALTLAQSRYVLIEFSTSESYTKLYQAMQEFILSGFIPIIAHIERYECLRKKEDRLEELAKLGCYLQVNADSVLGGFLDSEAAFLRRLLTQGKAHFIATDCHDVSIRSPKLVATLKKLSKSMDEGGIHRLLNVNPTMVLNNKYI